MVSWEIIENKNDWTSNLSSFNLSSYMQTWEWAEHRSKFGWKPFRFLARNTDKPLVMVQLLVKYLPMGIGLVWIPGGPVGKLEVWSRDLLNTVKELVGLKHVVLKISDCRLFCNEDVSLLLNAGWLRIKNPISTGLSLHLSLDESVDNRRSTLTGNWRHNLNRSQKKGLRFELWNKPSVSEIFKLYEEMEFLKGLKQQFSYDELESILNTYKENLLVVRCNDANGKTLSIRACLIFKNKAWDLLAAAGADARKTYATYGTLWELTQECHLRGVKSYDLGGVDPEGNKGVWNFKKGTGALHVEFLGEWEIATNRFLNACMNIVIRMKK